MCETFQKFMMKNRANDDDDDDMMNANDLILGRHGALEDCNFASNQSHCVVERGFFCKNIN